MTCFFSSRGILSASPLALFHHLVQIRNRPYLNRSKSILKAWKLCDKLNGVIEVSRLKDLNAAKLFLGFRIGTVGRRDSAVFPVQRQRGLRAWSGTSTTRCPLARRWP